MLCVAIGFYLIVLSLVLGYLARLCGLVFFCALFLGFVCFCLFCFVARVFWMCYCILHCMELASMSLWIQLVGGASGEGVFAVWFSSAFPPCVLVVFSRACVLFIRFGVMREVSAMYKFRFILNGLTVHEGDVCTNKATAMYQAREYVLDLLRRGWNLDHGLNWKLLRGGLFWLACGRLCLRSGEGSGCLEIVSLS